MIKKIGVFLNNTNSIIKYKINLNNYNILKKNFTIIIILDIDNKYSQNLKNYIEKDIDNSVYYIILQNNYSYIEKIKYVYNSINFDSFEYKYITFIDDNFIYLDSLNDYFDYIYSHSLEICPYSDSSEKEYHYNLSLFTFNNKISSNFIEYFKNIKNNETFLITINNFLKNIDNIIPFLKIAYIDCNIGYNLFTNIEYLEFLIENNFISIISLDTIEYIKSNYTFYEYNKIPCDFNIDVYREYDDLSAYHAEFLHIHFIKYGQYEFRKFKKDKYENSINNNYILPDFIRKKLNSLNILYYFDLPYEFNIVNYKNINKDLTNLSINELIFHWINSGIYENRKY